MSEPIRSESFVCPACGVSFPGEEECRAHIAECERIRAGFESLKGRWAFGVVGGICAVGRVSAVTARGIWIQGCVVSETFGRVSIDRMPQSFPPEAVRSLESEKEAKEVLDAYVSERANHVWRMANGGVSDGLRPAG